MSTSRNSESYSLLILDEHLWKWIDACNYNDSLVSSPDREECQTLLKRILAVWPVLLKLITSSQASPRPPPWMAYMIRAADRLILAARDVPMKAIRVHIDELTGKISDIEQKSSQLVEHQVEKEKIVFMSNYSSCESDYHKAVEYWPVWEPRVRQDAIGIIRAKLDEFYSLIADRRRELEKMHLDQLTIRDKWSIMRSRLNPEIYEDSSAWWGSVIKPPSSSVPSGEELPETISISANRLCQIETGHLIETCRGLRRLHLNATASIGILRSTVQSETTPSIPWSILRSTCIDLIKELTLVFERRKSLSSPIILQSINIIDILLRLLFSHDLSQFDEEEYKYTTEISRLKNLVNGLGERGFNPSTDPVIARFTADEKDECMQAAIARYIGETQNRRDNEKNQQIQLLLQTQGNLNSLRDYRQTNYEAPWKDVWNSWSNVVGKGTPVPSGITTPFMTAVDGLPPLRYSS